MIDITIFYWYYFYYIIIILIIIIIINYYWSHILFEGSLEVKLPTIWTDGKAEVGRVREEEEKRKVEEEYQRRERQKKEDPGAWKGRKVAKNWVFQCFLRLWRVEK